MKFSVEGITYDFDENLADNVELMDVEDVTGMSIPEWSTALARGSIRAMTALVWILRRRDEPRLMFDEVRFHPASLIVHDEEIVSEDESGKDE